MEVHSIGYHHPHPAGFVIDRPDGIGWSWLFLIFKTKAVVRVDGKDQIVEPNTILLYSNDYPEYYGAIGDEYIDDWFHFTIEPRDRELLEALEIPINQPVCLGEVKELSSLIRSMTQELYTAKIFSADMMDLYLKLFWFKLARQLRTGTDSITTGDGEKCDTMVHLRNRIYDQISSIESVEQLAKEMNMSQSALQHTYKKLFGNSIMADVIRSRLERAKLLLVNTNLPLRQIAEQSGYRSEFHLMRQFKEHEGMTPSQYREKCL